MAQKIKQDEIRIGENIRRVRLERGIGQTELVRMLQLEGVEMTRETLVKIERGIQHIQAVQLRALRDALDGAAITPPAPLHTDKLPAATEKQPFLLPVDVRWSAVISLAADAEDALSAGQETDDPVLAVRIDDWDGVQALADFQYLIAKPLCIVCDDGELLEAALRVYQGRALYGGGLPDSVLLPLRDKYGLLI